MSMTAASAKNASTNEFDATDGWETIIEESPATVILDEVGDIFIGKFVGVDHVEPEDQPYPADHKDYVAFDQYLFRDREGKLMAIPDSFKLRQGMLGKTEPGVLCRIELFQLIESGKGNPMKDFKVQVRKA